MVDDGLLAAAYEKCEVTVKRLVAFAKAVGVKTNLQSIDDLLPIIPHIKTSVEAATPDIAAIQFVWNRICHHGDYDQHCLEEGRQYHKGWGHYGTTYSPSTLCYRLQYLSWIPQKTSAELTFLTPAQASRELLPDGFPFDSGWHWLQVLGFGEDAVKQVQKQAEKEPEQPKLSERDNWQPVQGVQVQQSLLAPRIRPRYPGRRVRLRWGCNRLHAGRACLPGATDAAHARKDRRTRPQLEGLRDAVCIVAWARSSLK